jgi:succinate-semialdehyde dehydrogenase / glutarate-semialdehyde dehydrogenase
MSLKSINPFTNKIIKEHRELNDHDIELIITLSSRAFEEWRETGFIKRSEHMFAAAALLRSNIEEYAMTITLEMGKPIKEAIAEIEKCAWVCDYYAENAEKFLSTEYFDTDADKSYVRYDPLGPVLGIMPWNFPFWQVFRFAVPALMAGNTVLLKHASNTQMCGEAIESIFRGAGFPADVFRNLAVGSARVEKIIRNELIRAVSLTGSEKAGQQVAAVAGSVLKKCVLELGGSNAFVVLAGADVARAAETGVVARFQNAGQSCIAAKRFIIERSISEEFVSLFTEKIKKIRSGDPSARETEMGPLCSTGQAEVVEDQLERSLAMGARLVTGGIREKAFISPSLVMDVTPGMPLFDEEVFGPVAPVTLADDSGHALILARSTSFGLGVSLFTSDTEKAEKEAARFHDGAVFINGHVKSDPRLPFGGTLRSGYGRELSVHGIREFVNTKAIWLKK